MTDSELQARRAATATRAEYDDFVRRQIASVVTDPTERVETEQLQYQKVSGAVERELWLRGFAITVEQVEAWGRLSHVRYPDGATLLWTKRDVDRLVGELLESGKLARHAYWAWHHGYGWLAWAKAEWPDVYATEAVPDGN